MFYTGSSATRPNQKCKHAIPRHLWQLLYSTHMRYMIPQHSSAARNKRGAGSCLVCFQIFYLVINKMPQRCEVLYWWNLSEISCCETCSGTHLCTFGAQKTFSDDKNHNYFWYKLFGNTQPKKLLLLLVMDCGIMCWRCFDSRCYCIFFLRSNQGDCCKSMMKKLKGKKRNHLFLVKREMSIFPLARFDFNQE